MNNLEKFKAELAKDLSANTYSEEYILQRLDNLCLIAISQGKIEGANLEIIGDLITEPESIKPEDMVNGEWYHYNSGNDWFFRFSGIDYKNDICSDLSHSLCSGITYRSQSPQVSISDNYTFRKATREEVIKYFPNEFMPPEIDAHGGNDKGFICPASN
jgi:hypothetical protein